MKEMAIPIAIGVLGTVTKDFEKKVDVFGN